MNIKGNFISKSITCEDYDRTGFKYVTECSQMKPEITKKIWKTNIKNHFEYSCKTE
jgi:hypothetical protein